MMYINTQTRTHISATTVASIFTKEMNSLCTETKKNQSKFRNFVLSVVADSYIFRAV